MSEAKQSDPSQTAVKTAPVDPAERAAAELAAKAAADLAGKRGAVPTSEVPPVVDRCIRKAQSRADAIKNFEIRRDMIVHEDTLILQRIGFQLTTQSFLLTAAIILCNVTTLPVRFKVLMLVAMALVGVALDICFYLAVVAARAEQGRLRGDTNPHDGNPNYDAVFPLEFETPGQSDEEGVAAREAGEALRSRLQSCGFARHFGFLFVHGVHLLMGLLWLPFLFIGLAELVDVHMLSDGKPVPSSIERATPAPIERPVPAPAKRPIVLMDQSRGTAFIVDAESGDIQIRALPTATEAGDKQQTKPAVPAPTTAPRQ